MLAANSVATSAGNSVELRVGKMVEKSVGMMDSVKGRMWAVSKVAETVEVKVVQKGVDLVALMVDLRAVSLVGQSVGTWVVSSVD